MKTSNDICAVLEINGLIGDTICKGDPIILTVSLSNPDAREDENHNRMIDTQIAELEEKLSRKEVGEDEYKAEAERLKAQKIEIKTYTLGSQAEPWTKTIKFYVLEAREWRPLAWGLELLYSSPKELAVTLTGDVVAYAQYGLGPDKVKEIPEGTYQIKTVISTAESNIVIIGVTKKVDKKPSEEKLSRIAEYFIKMGAYEEVIKISNRMLEANPHSIQGNILMGEYYETRKEYDKALEALLKARKEFVAQNPDVYEPPRYIDAKITRILMLKKIKPRETGPS